MKHELEEAEIREIDDNLSIWDLFGGEDFNFDLVVADIEGDHPTVVNYESDRAYFVLEGAGTVEVGGQVYQVSEEDLVTIPSGTEHTINGDLRYLIITSPPFEPENEEVVEE